MSEIDEATHDLAWSAWTELGLPGLTRRHRLVASDPEILVVYTPHLSAADPRLRGLVFDWCACHARWLSMTRLASIAQAAPEPVREAFARFNGALRAEGIRWVPASADASPLERTRSTMALPIERPALVRFRMRSLAGVSTRAEILSRLVATGELDAEANRLTPEGVSRRSVERVLLDLSAAGWVVALGSGRNRRYRLSDATSFARLANATDLAWLDWKRTLDLVFAVRQLSLRSGASPKIRRVEAVAAGEVIASLASAWPRVVPPDLTGKEDAYEVLLAWGESQIRRLAGGGWWTEPRSDPSG